MKTILMATSAIALLTTAMPTMAQTTPEDDGASDAIIVTAQKREEKLQEVPLAISVIGGAAIANNGGVTLENAQYLVPSLNFRKSGTTLNQALFLRGVGTINFSIAAEPSVAAVLDGVVLSRAGEGFTDLTDIERIEVLRGPQGTLFGKNASAGVISIVSKRPTDQFEGSVEASYFSEREYRGRATINLPLSDTIKSRFTGFYGSYDGNIKNITTGNKVNGYEHYGIRGVIEAEVGAATFTLRGDYRKADDNCCAEIIGTNPANATAAALAETRISGDNTRRVAQNLQTATKEKSYGVSLQADVDIGDHVLTSISSYRRWDNREIRDGDFLDRAYVGITQLHDDGPQKAKTFTQEIRVSSPSGKKLEYVIGGYYSNAESDRVFSRSDIVCSASTLPAVAPGLTPCSTTPGVSTFTRPFGSATFGSVFKNLSGFGQATLNLGERLRLIGGLRYTHDKLDVDHIRRTTLAGPGIQPNFDAGVFNNGLMATLPATGFIAGPSNGVPFRTSTTANNLSGKGGIQFDISDSTMAYGSYTRGYKGPAYNIFFNLTAIGTGRIAPETVNAYEFGLKNTFLDGAFIANLAVYSAQYNNYQANNPDVVAGVRTTRLTNAGSVTTKGFELDLSAKPADNFSVNAGIAYNRARVKSFRLPPGADASQLIAPGTQLPNAPEWKMAVGADYRFETQGVADLELSAQMALQSDQVYELTPNLVNRAGTTIDGYATVDLSLAAVDKNKRWRVAFQVKNLFDKSFASSIISGGPGGSFRYIIPREADRYFGLIAKINFGGK